MRFEAIRGLEREQLVASDSFLPGVIKFQSQPLNVGRRKLVGLVRQSPQAEAISRQDFEAVRVAVDQSENRNAGARFVSIVVGI